jgi:hypothetical protein
MMRRLIASVTTICFVVTQSATVAGPHEEGLSAGREAIPAARSAVSAASAAGVVPQYGATPAETTYYGKPNLGAQGNAALALCSTRPGDPVCQAQLGAVRSANTARPMLPLDDPALLQARAITRSPTTVLGSLADFYAGCTTETTDKPAGSALKTCHRRIGIGEFTLQRTLSVAVELAPSCVEGEWFAKKVVDRNALDSMKVEAQCQMDRTDGLLKFRFHALGERGSCIDPQTVELPTAPTARPTFVTDLSPHWEYSCWSPFKVVMQAGSGCTDGQCTYQFEFGTPAMPARRAASRATPSPWPGRQRTRLRCGGPVPGDPGTSAGHRLPVRHDDGVPGRGSLLRDRCRRRHPDRGNGLGRTALLRPARPCPHGSRPLGPTVDHRGRPLHARVAGALHRRPCHPQDQRPPGHPGLLGLRIDRHLQRCNLGR